VTNLEQEIRNFTRLHRHRAGIRVSNAVLASLALLIALLWAATFMIAANKVSEAIRGSVPARLAVINTSIEQVESAARINVSTYASGKSCREGSGAVDERQLLQDLRKVLCRGQSVHEWIAVGGHDISDMQAASTHPYRNNEDLALARAKCAAEAIENVARQLEGERCAQLPKSHLLLISEQGINIRDVSDDVLRQDRIGYAIFESSGEPARE